jgi:monothiol glutaredoxin
MGIRSRVKKLILPIIGNNNPTPPASARPAPAPAARTYTPPEPPKSARGTQDPTEWIKEQVAEHPVFLFMKGNPQQPACGFSANASAILRQYDQPTGHCNVLEDGEVREAVKEFSNWPTIPQLYIGGEFMGGSDILTEMQGNGELKEAIAAAVAAKKAAE